MADDERKPDLVGSEYDDIERRVDQIMEPDKPESTKSKSAQVSKPDASSLSSSDVSEPLSPPDIEEAPVVKSTPKKIKIIHHDSDNEPEIKAVEADPEDEDTTDKEELNPSPDSSESNYQIDQPEYVPDANEASEAQAEDEAPQTIDEASVKKSEETEPLKAKVVPRKEPNSGLKPDIIPITADDKLTDKIVDDIVAKEGDEVLQAEDQKLAESNVKKGTSFSDKLKNFFAVWWLSKWARWGTILVVLAAVAAFIAFPGTRYFGLNSFGVRSSASLQVLDNSTQQPLKNVQVSIAGQSGITTVDGTVELKKLKLGPSTLIIQKRAFATISQNVTLGWGSNPLTSYKLTPHGTQYTILVSQFLSKKPVAKVEATSGDASALSDDKGEIKLTLDQPADTFDVTIKADGYRDEKITFNATSKADQSVQLVPSTKHVFVSKRSGKFDVYQIDADGKNEKLVLAGTGNERDDMVVIVHPTEDEAALISTRDSNRNSDGYLLSTLTMLNLKDGTNTKVTQSERIQFVDWIGSRLVYVQIASGTSAGNPKRYRLMSYDFKDGINNNEIASSNYFNDVLIAQNKIYFAPSSAYAGGSPIGLYRVDANGSNKQTIMAQETWNAFRTAYDHIVLSIEQKWFDYHIGDNAPSKLDGAPANLTNRVYIDSPDGKKSLWIDSRDGKGVLISYDIGSKKETTLLTKSGLKYPVRWLTNNMIVYRISTEQETADYVYNIDGGDPLKIKDVTNTGGIDKWYYY